MRLHAHQAIQEVSQRPAQVVQIPLRLVGGDPDVIRLQTTGAHAVLQGIQVDQGQPMHADCPPTPAEILRLRQLHGIDPPKHRPQFITMISFVKPMAGPSPLSPRCGDFFCAQP
ncbi:hypothetical protein C1930_17875 [Stenotrophomonas sp. SAU14A_NAIMI4_8]|nr:hypothetical protein C1930_17875 [Stenotrophomonas sp. SAU14A_NAIMI4_8]